MDASTPNDLIQSAGPPPASVNAASHFVVVKAPVARVYGEWSRIEDLPRFITALRTVRRIDETHFHYTWDRNGDDEEGVLHIVLQIPGRRIAWRTISNGFASGMVSFEPRSQQETEVTLKIRSIFDSRSLSQRVEEYLRNFKQLVENHHGEL
jgi:uncharacterized membrane protein